MRNAILDAAEKRIRAVGYTAVSFRDLAADVGIKSASVHYHFPQKADLAGHLVVRYAQRFAQRLDGIDRTDPRRAIQAFVGIYLDAMVPGEQICLCAMLGAEANGLPDNVRERVGGFFRMNVDWLRKLIAEHPELRDAPEPFEIISLLEGAMIVASATADKAILEATAARIVARFQC